MSIARKVYSSIKIDRSKVQKLSFWRCCDCCSVFFHLSSGISYDGVLRLSEAEDPILPLFGEESRGNCPPFDQGRAQSHEGWRYEVSPAIRTNRDSLSQARDRKALENDGQRKANHQGVNEQG